MTKMTSTFSLALIALFFAHVSWNVDAADARCVDSSPSALTTCSVGFTTCKSCVGSTDCCGAPSDSSYGVCKDSKAFDCPNGSKFICNGGNCPKTISCNLVNPTCTDKSHCWGYVSCPLGACPSGYKEGMFCHGDGNSGNFKVCCSMAPPPKVDCVVSAWCAWSMCNSTTGTQTRTRTVINPASNGGLACPSLVDTQSCPVDCVVTPWSPWGPCTAGTQTRTRNIVTDQMNGGLACPSLTHTQTCINDCVLSDWSPWGVCVAGTQTRTRTVVVPPTNNGILCGSLVDTQPCSISCIVSDWSNWGACGVSNSQSRTRVVVQTPYNAPPCPSLVETQSCVGCGAELVSFTCVLDLSKPSTDCVLPGGVLKVNVVNKPGYKKAVVRVNAKPTSYSKK
jgi:hypothetical protein